MIGKLISIASVLCFFSIFIGCTEQRSEDTLPAPVEPTPTITQVPPPENEASPSMTPIAVERFDTGVDNWVTFTDAGAISEVSWDPDGRLIWSTDTGANQSAALSNSTG